MPECPDFTSATWRKSSTSDSGGCVEIAYLEGIIGVRDTKSAGAGPLLAFTAHEWSAFLGGVTRGEFSLERLAE